MEGRAVYGQHTCQESLDVTEICVSTEGKASRWARNEAILKEQRVSALDTY